MSELSGIELRAAVAREVMGWRTGEYPDPKDPRTPVAVWLGDEVMHLGMPRGWTLEEHTIYVPHTIPHYERDIAAFGSVVRKMEEDGYEFFYTTGFGDTGIIGFKRPDESVEILPRKLTWGMVPTLGCRAALSAVRASTKEAK